jgi:regulator of RNase E activity RraA
MTSAQKATPETAAGGRADHAAEAARLGCAALVDAMGRLHEHRAHLLPLASPDPTRPLFGPAATIAYLPYRDDLVPESDFGALFRQAIDAMPGGRRVLVLSNGGYPDVSHAGGMKLSRVELHDLAGVVTDARLRDFNELRAYGFVTWCRGEAVHWGGDTVMPYAANIAVEISGVCVTPGDYVFIDSSGGVVIPAASLQQVFDMAHQIANEDEESLREIRRTDGR